MVSEKTVSLEVEYATFIYFILVLNLKDLALGQLHRVPVIIILHALNEF